MRSIRLLAVATGAVLLVSACGGDNGGVEPGENRPPVAGFSEVCTELSCVFTDTSTDPDGNNTITARSWNFGDDTPVSTATSPTHVYAAAGTYTVTLTVTDNAGATNAFSKQVTVTQTGPANVPPTASITLPTECTAGTPCGFSAAASTDPDGTIDFVSWNFGDQGVGEGTDVTHTYAAAGTYTVTLTVTDNLGATGTASQQLTVSPAASQDCTTSGTVVDCSLVVTQRSTIKVRVESTACELTGNRVTATAPPDPRTQTVFFNLCNQDDGAESTITDANGFPLVFEAGAALALRFTQGSPGPGDPPTGDPGIQVTGTYPTWTLNIDDGGAAGTPGEPDFDDAVLTVQATLAP